MNVVFTNTLYQLLSKLVSTLSTVTITVLITRFLGSQTWGDYSAVLAFIGFYFVLSEFGLNSIATKKFSEKGLITQVDFYSFIFLRFLFTLFLLFIGFFILQILKYPRYIYIAIIFSMLQVFIYSLSSSFNSIYQSRYLYKYLFYSTFIYSLINLSLFLYIIFSKNLNNSIYDRLWILFVPLLVAEFVRLLFGFFVTKKFISKSSKVLNLKLLKKYMLMSLPLGFALLFNTLMTQIDRLMLSKMVDTIYLGYYSLAYKLFEVLLVLPTFFMNSVFPSLVNSYNNHLNNTYNLLFSKSFYFLGFLSIIVSFFGLIFSPIFIPLIWGRTMAPAVYAFIILILGAPLFYLSSPLSWLYVVENRTKFLLYLYLFAFLLNFCLNLVIIPKYNYLGAAYTTLFTELFVLLALELFRRKYLKVKYTKFLLSYLTVWKK